MCLAALCAVGGYFASCMNVHIYTKARVFWGMPVLDVVMLVADSRKGGGSAVRGGKLDERSNLSPQPSGRNWCAGNELGRTGDSSLRALSGGGDSSVVP